MSIPNYTRPQHVIRQLLDRTSTAAVNRINPIVVGPQYLLARYGKESLPATTFASAGQTLTWRYIDANAVTQTATGANVDQDSVRVFAENLEAEVCSNVAGTVTVAKASPNVLNLSANRFKGGTLDANLHGRPVQVGDIVQITAPAGANYKRKVTGLKGHAITAHYGTNTDLDNGYFHRSGLNPSHNLITWTPVIDDALTITDETDFNVRENYNRGPVYDGYFGDKFYLTVLGYSGSKMQVAVTSASGLYSKALLTSADKNGEDWVFAADAETGNLEITVSDVGTPAPGVVYSFVIRGEYQGLSGPYVLKATGTYSGTKNTKLVVRVTRTNDAINYAAGAKVWVSDTAGLITPQEVTFGGGNNVAAGLGLTLQIAHIHTLIGAWDWFRVGDTFYIEAVAAGESTTEFDKLVLDGPAVDTTVNVGTTTTLTGISIRVGYTGEIEASSASDDSAWTSGTGGVVIQSTLSLYDAARDTGYKWLPFVNSIGSLYASFRALVPPVSGEGLIIIDTAADQLPLGTVDVDNDLAYGVNVAVGSSQNGRVYALRTAGSTPTAFQTALARAEATDMVYSFGIVSNDPAVFDVVKSHVNAMSTETQRKFRRAYVSTESPGEYAKITTNEDNEPLAVAISGTSLVANGTAPATAFNATGVLAAGDKVRVYGEGGSYEEYVIASVDSATQLTLVSGPANPLDGVTIEIWKADTPESQAAYVRSVSRGLGTRRMVNIWVEGATKVLGGVITPIPVKYVACEVAGLRAAVLPQQGLTRTEITSISDASPMFTRYTQSLLDQVAADGTMIITQDLESGAVYIRHQLTTDSSDGSLYWEDSVGTNLDSISFGIKDLLDGYIGRYNVTPATVAEIRNKIWHYLDGLTRTDFDTAVGPALIGFEGLDVAVDSVLRDRINVFVQVIMPLPLNNIVTTLRASVDVGV